MCSVLFASLHTADKVNSRQDWLTSAEHRLRASANTVLVSSIPTKWLSEEALRGLFDVFPGGIRNIWLTRDFTTLLDKIKKRSDIHKQLESAESDLIRECKRKQLKRRAQEEKRARKEQKTNKPTKSERNQRRKDEDEEAHRRAEAERGLTMGEVIEPVNADGAETDQLHAHPHEPEPDHDHAAQINPLTAVGLDKFGKLFKEAGHGVKDGISNVGHGIDSQLERSGGFVPVSATAAPRPSTSASDRWTAEAEKTNPSFDNNSRGSDQQELNPEKHMNTVRKLNNIQDMYVTRPTRWYEFWKPPTGGYASPVPQGVQRDPFDDHKPLWAKIKHYIPFMNSGEEPVEYPPFVNPGRHWEYEEQPAAEWERWVKPKDRPHHRLPLFEFTPSWLPGLPLIHKKVDTIYWCRKELARLNVEIEEDQKNPERFPVMTSAFIQFNNQAAAHMACQCAIHHVPKRMAPRVVEISPNDVIWENMSMSWWMQWMRVFVASAAVVGMVILWGFPVAFSASLSEIDTLISNYKWLGFLRTNESVYGFVKLAAGVLPQAFLAIILALVPIILNLIAQFQGVKTGSSRTEWVQIYYFLCEYLGFFGLFFLVPPIAQHRADYRSPVRRGVPGRFHHVGSSADHRECGQRHREPAIALGREPSGCIKLLLLLPAAPRRIDELRNPSSGFSPGMYNISI